ncbi:hypothetical protein BYT27DRAFT_7213295 [Phlegmacium glaucopus]|nr:hypothetical protein BYT27DRAFT_7213295 [Phlegmacium glaucopus]
MQTTVDILILGAGWTSTFLIPLCHESCLSFAATSRKGSDSTFKFEFYPDSDDMEPYEALPTAPTVLITFPIQGKGASERLVRLYTESRRRQGEEGTQVRFIQLGATSIWDPSTQGRRTMDPNQSVSPPKNQWYNRHSPILSTPRGEAEAELLALSPLFPTTVLNLAGLWGGSRSMRNWVGKVAPTKEVLKNKGSIHMIHGIDVARAILAVHGNFSKVQGQRWILTDGRVYDWWDLASAWGSNAEKKELTETSHGEKPATSLMEREDRGPQAKWVRELMAEMGVLALPRNVELLGRALDSRDFWNEFGLSPIQARLEG